MAGNGIYCVIEGVEGAGKSTALANVGAALSRRLPERKIMLTRHPGATPLGAHLRVLIKYPEQIDPEIRLDPVSSQLLMVADCSCFVNTTLKPALDRGEIVLADRSNSISSIAYGAADGVEYGQLDQMFRLARPPRADRLYVLRLPWQLGKQRMVAQGGGDGAGLDRFERKGDDFFRRVHDVYERLATGPTELTMLVNHSVALENIKFIDATRSPQAIADEIVTDLLTLIEE